MRFYILFKFVPGKGFEIRNGEIREDGTLEEFGTLHSTGSDFYKAQQMYTYVCAAVASHKDVVSHIEPSPGKLSIFTYKDEINYAL